MIDNNYEERGNWLQQIATKLIILNPPSFGKSDYESISNFKNKLIFIEKKNINQSDDNYIPCLFFRNPKSSDYLIFFHGNSEHIFQIEHYGLDFRSYLDMNVIMVEYPGYSIYPYENPDSNIIFQNSLIVYDWIKNKFKISDEQIFVCGRSLGTSTAIYLSSQRKPKALFLISAFTSIKNVGKDFKLSYFVEGIFNSYRYITNISCPILFIHGKKDPLINYHHSIELYNEIKKINNFVEIIFHENMTHNDFIVKDDIINPINDFINKHNLKSNKSNIDFSEEELNELYKIPLSISKLIESILFDINNFQFNKIISNQKDMIFSNIIDNYIVFSCGSKIFMYNSKNYSLQEEIEVDKNNARTIVKSIYRMKNKNIACGTDKGDIIIYENKSGFEENNSIIINIEEDKAYEIGNIIQLNKEIYKIDKFSPNLICVLTKNSIIFYNENFEQKTMIELKKPYVDYAQISENLLVMLSYNDLDIFQIQNNELQQIETINYIKLNINENNYQKKLITTNQYIIIGGTKCIYFIEHTKGISDKDGIKKIAIDGEINYIHKIHDHFFLASTNKGKIFQITLDSHHHINTKEKQFGDGSINSFLMKNFNTIIITDDNGAQIWNVPQSNNFCFCDIF